METQIPVIDLQEPQNLRKVCRKWGCFRLINHEVDTKLMAEMKSAIKELFDRPLEIKQRNKEVVAGSGYMAPNQSHRLLEAFGIFDVASPLPVSSFCSDLQVSPHIRFSLEFLTLK
ncbi:2-oxoglutarate-dependent dioxygenase DAO-like [Silene latifolia]|uniref:2-oxoglutarate-dependent dioxygenase DAO-like n=1 Tax=Silene latifolia TaxID=37657 RepID=UPI003D77DE94